MHTLCRLRFTVDNWFLFTKHVVLEFDRPLRGNYAFDLQDKVVKLQFFKATGGELLENNLKVFKNSSKVQYHFEVQRFMDSGEYYNTPKENDIKGGG